MIGKAIFVSDSRKEMSVYNTNVVLSVMVDTYNKIFVKNNSKLKSKSITLFWRDINAKEKLGLY